jgi:tetratricopeptide (TPR) repeat protein
MMDPRTPATDDRTLAELAWQIRESGDPARVLLDATLLRLKERDPELAEAVRLAAIPRRFDAEILGFLRDAEGDAERNGRLVEEIAALPFARTDGDAHYLHHSTQDLLLSDWRSSPGETEEFEKHNDRLASFFEERHQKAQQYGFDLGFVAEVVSRASPDRYVQLVSAIEDREVPPLLEVLHHRTQMSPSSGYQAFVKYFHLYERAGRLTVCETLLSAAREEVGQRQPGPEDAPLADWLRYYQARLDRAFGRQKKAEAALVELRATVKERKLQLWVLSELGSAYQEQYRLREALRVYEEELQLAVESRQDPFNIPASYHRVGSVQTTLWNLLEAARAFRDAARTAREEGRTDLADVVQLDLANTLSDRGRRAEALKTALGALDAARAEAPEDRDRHRAVADCFMKLIGRDRPRLMDTMFLEKLGLRSEIADVAPEPEAIKAYADLLRESGQLRRSYTISAWMAEGSGQPPPPSVEALSSLAAVEAEPDTSLLLNWALLLEERGELDRAAVVYRRIIKEAGDRPKDYWDVAASMTNLGLIERDRGSWKDALQDFEYARDIWDRMGHSKLSAACRLLSASTLLREHAYAALQEAASAEEEKVRPPSARVAADLARATGRWEEAASEYRSAAAEGNGSASAEALGRLAIVLSERGIWREAAGQAVAAAERWAEAATGAVAGVAEDGRSRAGSGGVFADVEDALDAADLHIDDDTPLWLGHLHEVRGYVRREQSRPREAADLFAVAVRLYELVGDERAAAVTRVERAEDLGRSGDRARAAAECSAAAASWLRVAERDEYDPTPERLAADRQNARGLWYFSAPRSPRSDAMRGARGHFRAAGQDLDNGWHQLNLSYAAAATADWAEAAGSLELALRLEPLLATGGVLERRMITYRLRHVASLVRTGDRDGEVALAEAVDGLRTLQADAANPGLAELWIEAGDLFLHLHRFATALEAYREGVELAMPGGGPALQARLTGRLAWALALEGEPVRAERLLALAAEREGISGAESLVRELGHTLSNRRDFDRIASLLRSLSAVHTLSSSARAQVVRARLALSQTAYLSAFPGTLDDATPPAWNPIVLEAHSGIFPSGDEWTTSHPLFQRYLPELRTRIELTMGVTVPGVIVRANDQIPPNAFVISLDAIPRFLGWTRLDASFRHAADPDRLREERGTAPDLHTGEPDGVWVAPDHAESLPAQGVELWDGFEYMARRLEWYLRRELPLFVGIQEVTALLDGTVPTESDPPDFAEWVARVRSSPELTAELTSALRSLLEEQVPIVNLAPILEAFEAAAGHAYRVGATVEVARLALRESLPGNRRVRTVLRTSADLENQVRMAVVERGGRRCLAAPPELVQALLHSVRSAAEDWPAPVTLVVEDPSLRPFLRALVGAQLPDIHVMAVPELVDALKDRTDGVVQLAAAGAPEAAQGVPDA